MIRTELSDEGRRWLADIVSLWPILPPLEVVAFLGLDPAQFHLSGGNLINPNQEPMF